MKDNMLTEKDNKRLEHCSWNAQLRADMLAGKEERKDSFIKIVDDFEKLYQEAITMKRFIGDSIYTDIDELDYEFSAWCNFVATKVNVNKRAGTYSIYQGKAKQDIFFEIARMEHKPGLEKLRAITHKWDMWHHS
jgi:hypothetical protein